MLRAKKIGIIYQQDNLLSDFTAIENIYLASLASGISKANAIVKSKNLLRDTDVFENNELISSISKTLFVLHSIYGDNFVFCNFKNLDLLLTVSISNAKSKLLIVSTRFWSIKSSAKVSRKVDVVTPALVEEVIPTSAKFFNPLVWRRRLTGFI